MLEWTLADWEREADNAEAPFAVFVYTPLCGTCGAARKMLDVAMALVPDFPIRSLNVNLAPIVAQRERIESVPCLLLKRKDGTWHKHYRFPSVTDWVERLRSERDLL